MEIEIPRIDMEPGELREWLLNITYYLLEKGPVLKHGETIGMSAELTYRDTDLSKSVAEKAEGFFYGRDSP